MEQNTIKTNQTTRPVDTLAYFLDLIWKIETVLLQQKAIKKKKKKVDGPQTGNIKKKKIGRKKVRLVSCRNIHVSIFCS